MLGICGVSLPLGLRVVVWGCVRFFGLPMQYCNKNVGPAVTAYFRRIDQTSYFNNKTNYQSKIHIKQALKYGVTETKGCSTYQAITFNKCHAQDISLLSPVRQDF